MTSSLYDGVKVKVVLVVLKKNNNNSLIINLKFEKFKNIIKNKEVQARQSTKQE